MANNYYVLEDGQMYGPMTFRDAVNWRYNIDTDKIQCEILKVVIDQFGNEVK